MRSITGIFVFAYTSHATPVDQDLLQNLFRPSRSINKLSSKQPRSRAWAHRLEAALSQHSVVDEDQPCERRKRAFPDTLGNLSGSRDWVPKDERINELWFNLAIEGSGEESLLQRFPSFDDEVLLDAFQGLQLSTTGDLSDSELDSGVGDFKRKK